MFSLSILFVLGLSFLVYVNIYTYNSIFIEVCVWVRTLIWKQHTNPNVKKGMERERENARAIKYIMLSSYHINNVSLTNRLNENMVEKVSNIECTVFILGKTYNLSSTKKHIPTILFKWMLIEKLSRGPPLTLSAHIFLHHPPAAQERANAFFYHYTILLYQKSNEHRAYFEMSKNQFITTKKWSENEHENL